MWTPHHRHALWTGVSRAVRMPARTNSDFRINFAAYPDPTSLLTLISIFGNPDLSAEDLLAYELGYRFQPKSSLSFDVATFYNVYKDAIMIMGLNEDELTYYADRVKAPLVGLYATVEPIAFQEFKKRKYAMAIGTTATLFMYIRGLVDGLRDLKKTEDWNAIQHRMVTREEFFDILDLDKYRRMYEEFSIQ